MGKLDTIIDSVTAENLGGADEGFKVSEVLKGDIRLDGESYDDFKIRRKAEKGLVRDYLKGRFIAVDEPKEPREPFVRLVTKNKEGGRI